MVNDCSHQESKDNTQIIKQWSPHQAALGSPSAVAEPPLVLAHFPGLALQLFWSVQPFQKSLPVHALITKNHDCKEHTKARRHLIKIVVEESNKQQSYQELVLCGRALHKGCSLCREHAFLLSPSILKTSAYEAPTKPPQYLDPCWVTSQTFLIQIFGCVQWGSKAHLSLRTVSYIVL